MVDTNTGASGSLNCLRQITSRYAGARILLIINREDYSVTNEAIRLGAKGVVTMEIPSPILRRAIRLIDQGRIFIEPWLAEEISETLHHHHRNPFDALSPREHAVLHMMLEG